MDGSRNKINLKVSRVLTRKKNRDPSPELRTQDRIPLGGNPPATIPGIRG